jgi:Fe-S oxidoreductase/nitrate reductase gamma subunit
MAGCDHLILICVLAGTGCAFLFSALRHLRRFAWARSENRFNSLWYRLKFTILRVLGQNCVLKDVTSQDRAGLNHFFLFWGFLVFSFSYIFLVGEGLSPNFTHNMLGSNVSRVVGYLVDAAGIIVLGSIIWAVRRRFIIKPDRIEPSLDAALVLSWVFLLMVVFFLQEGFEVSLNQSPFGRPLGGFLVAQAITIAGIQESSQVTAAHVLFWLHIGLICSFLIYIPYSKHLHIFASPFNVFFHSLQPRGKLTTIDFGALEKNEMLPTGAGKVSDLTWKQMLDLYACAECGRCQEMCPAYLTGKPLSPWKVIKDLRKHLLMLSHKEDPKTPELGRTLITSDELWACTTCYGCQGVCPVLNEHVSAITEIRRHQVLHNAQFPTELRKVFRNLEIYGDPLGMGKARRLDWARSLPDIVAEEGKRYDYLLFVGCTAAFIDHNQESVRILAQLLLNSGYSVGILGKEEICCGDPFRRLGNELAFQRIARKNISVFGKYSFENIITACPHCFNTLKYEYPDCGGVFEVVHHTELLARLLEEKKLTLENELTKRVVYHDPCYLGRYNSIYDAPRKTLDAIEGLQRLEMARSGEQSFCCGGGGGCYWMEERTGENINQVRLEEALNESPDMIVTACPFCASMFDDALSLQEEEMPVQHLDIIQLVKEAGGITS